MPRTTASPKKKALQVRIEEHLLHELHTMANTQGTQASSLVRDWIRSHIARHKQARQQHQPAPDNSLAFLD